MSDDLTRLPADVVVTHPKVHSDDRGRLLEMHRDDRLNGETFVQWNLVRSEGNVLRGVHVHPGHADCLHVIEGTMILGLHDLRPENPKDRISTFVELTGARPTTAFVPEGVCHGFFFPRPTVYCYGLSRYWSMAEELGCGWDDPALGLDWRGRYGVRQPVLSPRDRAPTGYDEMRAAFFAARRTAREPQEA